STRRPKKQERRSTISSGPDVSDSPPAYSVEENSEGELVNSRLNVKWPQPVDAYDVSKYRYLTPDATSDVDSPSDSRKTDSTVSPSTVSSTVTSTRKSSRKSRRSKRERRERRREKQQRASSKDTKDPQYITLSTGSERDNSDRGTRARNRMIVQTSPQVSRKSYGGFHTDDDGRKIDSVVFDTRSAMLRYQKNSDVLPRRRRSRRRASSKSNTAVERLDKEENYDHYYLGVKSKRSVEKQLSKPGAFAIYYEKPSEGDIPVSVCLNLAYRFSASEAYHFPIRSFDSSGGRERHFVVMQNHTDCKMFSSLLELVKHYALYAHVDPSAV
ncbi:hypothetical protein PFISCL1PPCAC_17558, partial [Pristionchus fissidentatus]